MSPYLEPNYWWELQRRKVGNLEECLARAEQGPTMAERLKVEALWGVAVYEQLELESYFGSLTKIQEIDHPTAIRLATQRYPDWEWAARNLTVYERKGTRW